MFISRPENISLIREKQLKADSLRRQLLAEGDDAAENPLNSEFVLGSS